jgi:hypothetical protein
MTATARLSNKFQISIPGAARQAQAWEADQWFAFIPKGKGVLVVSVPHRDAPTGIASGADPRNHRDGNDRF